MGAVAAHLAVEVGVTLATRNREQKKANKTGAKIRNLIRRGATIGVLTHINPAYLPISVGRNLLVYANALLHKRFSRHQEYQADRGAAVLGANPLALITALRKLSYIQEKTVEKKTGKPVDQTTGWLSKKWRAVNATHPGTPQRIKKLAKLAKQQGATAEAMDLAIKGPITLNKDYHEIDSDLFLGQRIVAMRRLTAA